MSVCKSFLHCSCWNFVSFSAKFKNRNFYNRFYTLKASMTSKPPNILVFTGNNCPKLFKNIENKILRCVLPHKYLVYHLLPSEVVKQLWVESTLLLIVSANEIDDGTASVFENYIKNFGKILLVCCKFNSLAGNKCILQTETENLVQVWFKGIGQVSVYQGKYSYFSSDSVALCQNNQNRPVINKTVFYGGILIASEIYLDRDPKLSANELVSLNYDNEKCLLILENILTDELGLLAKSKDYSIVDLSPGYYVSKTESEKKFLKENEIFHECSVKFQETERKLNIYYHSKNNSKLLYFDTDLYFSNLSAETYGHNLVYFPAITSTMDVVEQLSDCEGIVIVASNQLNGIGRGLNKWISPMGCAMFTLQLTFSLYTNLGQKLSLIQHIAALAVVHGIRKQQQYKDLNIKIKWPNDIYFDECKIGGLIVSSTIQGKLAVVNIGWGINVANSDPTLCINDIIKIYNEKKLCELACLHVEEVIASTISQMEYFVKDFQNFGPDKVFSHYYSYWMHKHKKVTLENLNETGTIMGLDEYGFLIVKTVKGEELTLQPDGNRFDITKNLIYSRK